MIIRYMYMCNKESVFAEMWIMATAESKHQLVLSEDLEY